MPNIIGKNLKEAKSILKENNLQLKLDENNTGIDEETTIIKEQIPKEGVGVNENSYVYVEW